MAASVTFRGYAGVMSVERDRVQADALLTAGLETAAGVLDGLRDTPLAEIETSVTLGTGAVRLRINDEGGRIDIGNYPAPAVVYAQPVVVAPAPAAVYQQPIYLYVPPVHQANWGRYCGRYAACGQPVYFVQETWIRENSRREYRGRDRHNDRQEDRHNDRRGKQLDKEVVR